MKCRCGNNRFYAHQLVRMDIVVDQDNEFWENVGSADKAIYDSERPYGPYTCTVCGKEYDSLHT